MLISVAFYLLLWAHSNKLYKQQWVLYFTLVPHVSPLRLHRVHLVLLVVVVGARMQPERKTADTTHYSLCMILVNIKISIITYKVFVKKVGVVHQHDRDLHSISTCFLLYYQFKIKHSDQFHHNLLFATKPMPLLESHVLCSSLIYHMSAGTCSQ